MNKSIRPLPKHGGGLSDIYFNSIGIPAENPDLIRIVPVGKFPAHTDGGHEVTPENITEMAENLHRSGADILFDFGHESLWNASAAAAGWSAAADAVAKEDGLYIPYPKFAKKAAALIKDDQYRYFSPVYTLSSRDKEGNKTGAALLSVALTNTPYFDSEIDHIRNSASAEPPAEAELTQIIEKIGILEKKLESLQESYAGLIVNSAVSEGKISPSEKEDWRKMAIQSPSETSVILGKLISNSAIPEFPANLSEAVGQDNDPLRMAVSYIKTKGR
ncbi:MAG: phage protease [Ignavibacteriales bacterium]|nr:phage protease [Ignavibacteriales bacterium]MCF8316894.1 phage protease [Ignavibacteriales bacterium]MCF8438455.1 phage protease [Ignavibacteriales bacterium]